MLLYTLLEAASRYRALKVNQYSVQRKYPSWKEDLSQICFIDFSHKQLKILYVELLRVVKPLYIADSPGL